MKRLFSAPAILAAGVLAGLVSAAGAIQVLGSGKTAGEGPWQLRDTSIERAAHPYIMASYLLDGRLPQADRQFIELYSSTDSEGNRLMSSCVYVVRATGQLQASWWSLSTLGSGGDSASEHGVITSANTVATAEGAIAISVSAYPSPGNWIKAPPDRSFTLQFLAARVTQANVSPRQPDTALFSIERTGC